jgi:dTDP-glucose pyrophosphorylase
VPILKIKDNNMTLKLVMPMAGLGRRFTDAGYSIPKPLIPINGIPMFVHAERSIGLDFDERIFIINVDHVALGIKDTITEYYPDAKFVEVDIRAQKQQNEVGAAITLATAHEHFQDGSEIFVSNCDQIASWDVNKFNALREEGIDGMVAIFHCPDRDPKWSYIDPARYVREGWDTDNLPEPNDGPVQEWDVIDVLSVAEKDPISDWATVGWYYWNKSNVLLACSRNMIDAGDSAKVNGEYYVAPLFNHMPQDDNPDTGVRIGTVVVNEMTPVGTPEDLMFYLGLEDMSELDSYMVRVSTN